MREIGNNHMLGEFPFHVYDRDVGMLHAVRKKMSDKINHPSHYTAGSIEVYDFIEAWNLDFSIGNVVKYVSRAPYKGTKLDDLKKAEWYLKKAIEKEERAIAERVANSLSGKDANYPDQVAVANAVAWAKQKVAAYHMHEMEMMKNQAESLRYSPSLLGDKLST